MADYNQIHVRWRTTILGTVLENFTSTSLTYVMIGCSIICTSLNTLIPITENGPPNNVGMKIRFHGRLKCTGLHKLQHCLRAGGKGGERKEHRVNIVLRRLSPIVVNQNSSPFRSK